jgi:MFS family permease
MDPDMSISPKRQRLLLAAVVSGLLLAMLDQTIVGTALPAIVRDLDGWSSYLWVVTAYLVPATVSLPVYARLSDRHGRRALLLIGMALFLLGSALSASAQDMTQLIAWRGLQGLGAGALEGLSFILVADLYAGRRSAALQGMLAGLMGLSFIAGPLVGGFLADQAGWRWVFLVNLPIGIAAMAVVARVLPGSIGRRSTARASTWPGSRCSPPRSGCCSSASTSTRAWPRGATRAPAA